MITIHTLDTLAVPEIHEVFIEAFSDYEVKVDISLADFIEMLVCRDIQLSRSFGAFDSNRLVGFFLCGYRNRVWYDGGTGVIPSYRNQKLASALIEHVVKRVDQEGETFVLEVLEHNTVAKDLYEKYGFIVNRTLDCYAIETQKLWFDTDTPDTVDDSFSSYESLNTTRFLTYTPSWQNNRMSVAHGQANYRYVGIVKGKETIAYGIVHVAKGDVVQLGVISTYRKTGLERRVLSQLARRCTTEKMVVLNVQRGKALGGILQQLGFDLFVSQYEMKRPAQKVSAS